MNNFLADPRVGTAVSGSTGLVGFLTRIGLTPELLGMIATLIGIILSLVIIAVHISKMISDSRDSRFRNEKNRLEIEQLKWKLEREKKLARNDPAM